MVTSAMFPGDVPNALAERNISRKSGVLVRKCALIKRSKQKRNRLYTLASKAAALADQLFFNLVFALVNQILYRLTFEFRVMGTIKALRNNRKPVIVRFSAGCCWWFWCWYLFKVFSLFICKRAWSVGIMNSAMS